MATKFAIASIIAFAFLVAANGIVEDEAAKSVDPKDVLSFKEEKLTHFKLYWHDVLSGKNPTAAKVVDPVNSTSRTAFGQVNMIDNAMTVGPYIKSKLVARAQGFYAAASQEELGFLMAMNVVFVEGKYNGSTIALLGRNAPFDGKRELSVVGGSGLFRFARGYAELRTHVFDIKTGDATVQYNIYVLHY